MTKKKGRAASMGELGDLHAMLAKFMTHRLKESMPDAEDELVYNDETGEYEKPFKMPLASSEVSNIIAFLKHNDVSAEPDDEVLSELRSEFDEDFELRRKAQAEKLLAVTKEESEQANWI